MTENNKNDAKLFVLLAVAKSAFEALQERKLGLFSRQEGLHAWFNSVKDENPSEETQNAISDELDRLLTESIALREAYAGFAEWTVENLPEEYHYKVPQ